MRRNKLPAKTKSLKAKIVRSAAVEALQRMITEEFYTNSRSKGDLEALQVYKKRKEALNTLKKDCC